jgi:hypothetical protein
MKTKTTTLAIVLFALLLNITGCATGPTPAELAFAAVAEKTHSAVSPEPRSGDWWTSRNAAVNKRVAEGNVDLILIGDSITHSWDRQKDLWDKYYAPRNTVNMGFSGDRTQHVLWRLDNGHIDGIDPKLATIMIGTNNSTPS